MQPGPAHSSPAVRHYLEQLERELKRTPGVSPEEALSDAREFLESELLSLRDEIPTHSDEQVLEHFLQVFGPPEQVAAAYAEAAEPASTRPGNAPNWRICCTHCGRSAPADQAGIVRIGARSWHKYCLGYCRECRRLRWLRLIRDLEQPNLTHGLGADKTPAQLRRAMHHPRLTVAFCVAAALLVPLVLSGTRFLWGRQPQQRDALFQQLPPGWALEQTYEAPADKRDAIGGRLGGRIERLTNTTLSANGQRVQVNLLQAATDDDAQRIERSLRQANRNPRLVQRQGTKVYELVSANVQLALDARYRLGIQPRKVSYRVSFQAAPLASADYAAWNRLFNLFLELDRAGQGETEATKAKIADLSRNFRFSDRLALRRYGLGPSRSSYVFRPDAAQAADVGDAAQSFQFQDLPRKAGAPCVSVVAQITAETYAATPSQRQPGNALLAATKHWPSTSPQVVDLAKRITENATTDGERVKAILAWLQPGKNLRYDGKAAGSRDGVVQVLQQGFGRCWDFSDCFVSLCRASGIPCRQVAGWLYGAEGHIWAEVLMAGQGWVQVDPTAGMPCGSDYIPYLVSEDGELPLVYLSAVRIEVLQQE
jgi:hypothetical protein